MWLDPEKEKMREKFEAWKNHPLTDLDVLYHVQSIEVENEDLKKELKKYKDFFANFNSLLGNNKVQYYDSRELHCQEIIEKLK